jgi:stage V sporulation protein AD
VAKLGEQTWLFESRPGILATGTVAGSIESQGPLGDWFDVRMSEDRLGMSTWEHAEQKMFGESARITLDKATLAPTDVELMIGGDLNAQMSAFHFGLRPYAIPALGVFSACASICEALAIAAMAIDGGYASNALVGTASHNSTVERQFRYPTEYGVQKPPTAQRTVTGAGTCLLGRDGGDVCLSAATIGTVTDLGIKSPWEMGAAMAPAAEATLMAHFQDTARTPADYDCIATGDLGRVGHAILCDLLAERKLTVDDRLTDCGMLIFRPDQPEVFSGGSGGACCTLVTFAHLFRQLHIGKWKRILIAATGALLSSVTAQQGDSIPCISHAIVLERREERT